MASTFEPKPYHYSRPMTDLKTIEELVGAYIDTVGLLLLRHPEIPETEQPTPEFQQQLINLVKSHLFQLGAIGGKEYPRGNARAGFGLAPNGYECPGDLKRCEDGSCVPHGIGCLT